MDSYYAFCQSDSTQSIEKVLKYDGDNFDIRKRADIKREVVVFKLLNGTTDYRLDDEKPSELNQRFQALVYIEQPDSHSLKDTIYDRALEISDQLFDWATTTTASDVNSDLWTLTVIGVDGIEERDGYLSTVVNFESIIQIS